MNDRRRPSRTILIIVLAWCGALPAFGRAGSIANQLTTIEKTQLQREARLVVDLVQNLHFSGATFHEIKNQEILDRYLSELDPLGDIFSPDDLQFIHRRFDRSLKSVYLFRGDLEPAFEICDMYVALARERLAWVDHRLTQPFDFSVDESYQEVRPGDAFVPTTLTADQRWDLRLKDRMLHEILSGRTEDEARTALREQYAESSRTLAVFDSFAVREHFLDAAIRSFDPHSGYSSADSTREFATEMKGGLTGIGIAVNKEHGKCVVEYVYPGSPADLKSTLAPGDVIEALAQDDGPWVETSGQRLREIAASMRGTDNGKLRIAYRAEGTGDRKEIALDRTTVVLGANRAYGAVSQVPLADGRILPVGWIVLPAFYAGGEGPDTTSAARDVRELIAQMKLAHIRGLVIDLRRNPGGTLTEAVAMSQIFLESGNVMLSRGVTDTLKVHALKQEAPAYDGPLVVLTSPLSASASEIFAGAMKYHHRALIVGGKSTFGKGTAQNYIDLAKVLNLTGSSVQDWGTLRLTSERFYLPDGSAVQGRGILSDAVCPGLDRAGEKREPDLPHSLLPEDVKPPAPNHPASSAAPALSIELLQQLTTLASKDTESLPEWKLWMQERDRIQEMTDRRSRTVMMSARQEAWGKTLFELNTSRQIRRDFAAGSSFPTVRIDIATVKAASDAHEAMLRGLAPPSPEPPRSVLARGLLAMETAPGKLHDLRIQNIDFRSFLGEADGLAAAFAQGSGRPTTAVEIRSLLQGLSLLEHKTDGATLAVAAKLTGLEAKTPALGRGVEAMLGRMTELEPQLLQELPSFDIPMRECLRLAASWADRIAPPRP